MGGGTPTRETSDEGTERLDLAKTSKEKDGVGFWVFQKPRGEEAGMSLSEAPGANTRHLGVEVNIDKVAQMKSSIGNFNPPCWAFSAWHLWLFGKKGTL